MTPRLVIGQTDTDAVALVVTRLMDAVRAKPAIVLGVAAGRTFEPVYAALAEAQPDLSRATLVQLDEYAGIRGDHPGSFRAFLETRLVGRLSSPPRQSLWIDGASADPEMEIRRHANALADLGGLDLQLLGLGANGHVAFNEPGSSADSEARVAALSDATRASARSAGLEPPPTHGLTLGLSQIATAGSLLLVVLGAGKAAILARVLRAPVDPMVPASLLSSHPDLTVIADAAAASELLRQSETLDV